MTKKTYSYFVSYVYDGGRFGSRNVELEHPIRDWDDVLEIEKNLKEKEGVPILLNWQRFEKEE